MVRDLWIAQQTLQTDLPQPLEVRVYVGVDPDGSIAHMTIHVVSVPGEKIVGAYSSQLDNSNAYNVPRWQEIGEHALSCLLACRGPFD